MANPPDKTPTPDEKEKKQEKPFVKDRKERAEQERVNKQCFLIRNIESFMQKKAIETPAGYANFSCVSGPPMDITNELVAIKGLDPMFALTSAQHAVLQPRIRLFLVRGGKNVEMPFDASLSTGASTGASISDMVKSANYRGSGTGIKDFSYELAGVNPAEADRLITANLSLYFKSIADLFTERANADGDTFQYSDLINYVKGAVSSKVKKSTKAYIEDDSDRYAIRAVLGWADPPLGHPLFSPEIRTSLSQAKATLNLQLVDHSIKFNQDGTIQLDIEYMASLDYALATASLDIFWLPETLAEDNLQNEIQAISDNSRALVESQNELRKVVTRQQTFAARQKDAEAIEALSKTVIELEKKSEAQTKKLAETVESAAEKLEQIRRLKRTATYRRIIDLLVGPEDNPSQGKLYKIRVEPSELGILADLGVANSKINATLHDSKTQDEILTKTSKVTGSEQKKAAKERVADVAKAASDDGKVDQAVIDRKKKTVSNGTLKSKVVGALAGKIAKFRATGEVDLSIPTLDDGKIDILFFYLGDLVDVALKILKGNIIIGEDTLPNNKGARETLKNFRILMGPAILTNEDGTQKNIGNIADIPISFDLFENWFIHHVIRPQKTSYSLKRFLQDVMRELMAPALGSGCYGGERQKGKIASIPVRAAKTASDNPKIPPFSRCGLNHLKSRKGLKLRSELFSKSKSIRREDNYLYFYMPDHNVADKKVDENDDIRNGIYHLRVGADAGLVKSVEFEKTNIPFLKESRIANDAETKNGFLREKYDANITMVGNTFFSPGQYVYVHPSVPGYRGVGADGSTPNMSQNVHRHWLQTIGFGGYYLITKVDHRVSPDYYQTELTARWEAFGNPSATNVSYRMIPGSVGLCIPKEPELLSSFDIQASVDKIESEINQEVVENVRTGFSILGPTSIPQIALKANRLIEDLTGTLTDERAQTYDDSIATLEETDRDIAEKILKLTRDQFGSGEDGIDLGNGTDEDVADAAVGQANESQRKVEEENE